MVSAGKKINIIPVEVTKFDDRCSIPDSGHPAVSGPAQNFILRG